MSRRVKCFEIARDMFAELMRTGTDLRVEDGIPENAEIVTTGLRPGEGTFYVVAEHPDFPPVKEGAFLDLDSLPKGEIFAEGYQTPETGETDG